MKKPSRLAILAVTLMLGGASMVLVANAAAFTVAHVPPGASQQQTGERQDGAEKHSGTQSGHQDAPGTAGQTGDHQD